MQLFGFSVFWTQFFMISAVLAASFWAVTYWQSIWNFFFQKPSAPINRVNTPVNNAEAKSPVIEPKPEPKVQLESTVKPVIFSSYAELEPEESKGLKKGQWFNDGIITKYLEAMSKNDSSIYVLPPGYLANAEITKLLARHFAEESSLIKKLREAKTILCPIEWGHHWYLMTITQSNNNITIDCLDGFNSGSGHDKKKCHKHKIIHQLGHELVKQLYPENEIVELKSTKVEPQKNGDDCGVVVCYHGARICGQPNHNLEFGDYPNYRQVVSDVLDESVRMHSAATLTR